MNLQTLMWPAIGAGLIYAAQKVSAVPAVARAPLTVIGTLMLVKPVVAIQSKI